MKRRIFLFHTLTLVAALVILLAVSGGVVRWVMDAYQRQDTPSADQNMEQARQAIDEWDTGNWNWEGLDQMLRVLTNLKENAVRYAGAQPLVLTLTVWRQPERACIRFADNGHGVPEEQLPHLFEQFWRGDQARSSQGGEGSGLGLYIVKYIVEAHGGTVRARNDNGLVFELALPLEEVRRDEQNSDCRG